MDTSIENIFRFVILSAALFVAAIRSFDIALNGPVRVFQGFRMDDPIPGLPGAKRDVTDLRDYSYAPRPALLPVEHMPWDGLLAEVNLARLVRMQTEGTCVGHALAALIEIQAILRGAPPEGRISAAMLYRMARFFDMPDHQGDGRQPGIRSLRSAIKAFFHHGACLDLGKGSWPENDLERSWLSREQADAATQFTLGTYSRLQPILHHYHCAVVEAGAVLATAEIHEGWRQPDPHGVIRDPQVKEGRSLHAFVIVGYDARGFLILNSWGSDWGGVPPPGGRHPAKGLAILPYADWARSIADGWVLRLGVPGEEAFAINAQEQGLGRNQSRDARRVVPQRMLRGHFLNLDAGRWQQIGPLATPEPVAQETVARIRDRLCGDAECRGVVVALPGVFEGEARGFAKAIRLKTAFAARGLDFLACFWSANIAAEMQAVLNDIFARCRERAGGDAEALDTLFEETARGAGRAFWRDIERHAYCAAMPCDPDGGMWRDEPGCADDRGRLGDAILDLAQACAKNGKVLHLLANGSGALVVDALLKRVQTPVNRDSPLDWLPGLGGLVLTFPAVPLDQAGLRILPLARAMARDRKRAARILVPSESLEGRLTASGYGRSILQLVSRSFLERDRNRLRPMLGSFPGAPVDPPLEEHETRRTDRLDQQDLEDDPRLENRVIDAVAGGPICADRPHPPPFFLQEHVMDTAYPPKITLKELQDHINSGELTPDELHRYFTVDEKRSEPFSPVLVINSETVQVPPGSRSALALNSANAAARWLRRSQYDARIGGGYDGPRIASEGDSWFQYPLRLFDVIDYVAQDYAVFDTSAAGDLLENMARKRDYIDALKRSEAEILLLSAGGNDVCAGGNLARHLERFDPALKPADYLRRSYRAVMDNAIASYERICRDVNRHFPGVTIIVHGYDYVIPDNGRWLGKPMAERGIKDRALQRAIAAEMIDQFNRELRRMAQGMGHVAYVDCRNCVGDGNWFDELHPTDRGFAKVASLVLTKVKEITARRPQPARSASWKSLQQTAHMRAGHQNRAYSLHVGLNAVDPRHYADNDGKLYGCENDARAMRGLARAEGFIADMLLTGDATREAVIEGMRRAARDLRGGDQFLFTFAGHGSRITDMNGDEEANPKGLMDSTLCLFDSQMIDDEFWHLCSGFQKGVRVTVVADCCHSGTMVRKGIMSLAMDATAAAPIRPRNLPRVVAAAVEDQNRDFYERIARELPHVDRAILASVMTPLDATVIQFSACEDDQEAADGDQNGAFTAALLRVWNSGAFTGSHTALKRKLAEELAGTAQTPGLFTPQPQDPAFARQRPFTVPQTVAADGPGQGWYPAAADDPESDPEPRRDKALGCDDDADPLTLADDGEDAAETGPRAERSQGRALTVPDAVVRKFRDFMKPFGIVHFDPEEFLFLGSAHFGNGKARGLNAAPPETLWPNIVSTARVLDTLRSRLEAPIRIISAYRTLPYNEAIDGERQSWHLQFRACDITADGIAPSRVADALARIRDEGDFLGGIGRYDGFTHVDTRGVNQDWPKGRLSTSRTQGDDRTVARLRRIADTMPESLRPRSGSEADRLGDELEHASAAVNGAEVMALGDALTADQRRAVLYSSQFAQRAADAAADRLTDRTAWWTTYNAALAAMGWTITGSITREATAKDLKATLDAMAIDIMVSVAGMNKLRAIRAVLDGLRSLAENDKRLVLLDTATSCEGGGAIQIGEAELDKGSLVVTTGAVQFSTSDTRKQVLFAKWGGSAQQLWLAAERLVLNEDFFFSTALGIVEDRLGDAASRIMAFDLSDTYQPA